ncbi:hypothetical protein ARMGADRAFT_1020226 [Armillaria gallica]|uniref:Uncharacterized protein n=1 Tax=Armillaria gallica TaxID=47427 RepID=A0A2H3CT35_ARMGA|nr:hypothetical protein ARMGADRAFT_1020226 [Armillaria gallica]
MPSCCSCGALAAFGERLSAYYCSSVRLWNRNPHNDGMPMNVSVALRTRSQLLKYIPADSDVLGNIQDRRRRAWMVPDPGLHHPFDYTRSNEKAARDNEPYDRTTF